MNSDMNARVAWGLSTVAIVVAGCGAPKSAPSSVSSATSASSAPSSATPGPSAAPSAALNLGLGGEAPPVPPGAKVQGRLDIEIVHRILHGNRARINACYRQALKTNPALRAQFFVKLVIDRSGVAIPVADDGWRAPESALQECVIRAIASLPFPVPSSGIAILEYPFTFEPIAPLGERNP